MKPALVADSPAAVPVQKQRRPVVVLGVAPAEAGQQAWHPSAASSRRLAELADVQPEALAAVLALDNLVPYPDPSRRALREAGQLYRFLPGYWYLLAGSEVVRALGKRAKAGRSKALPWYADGPGPLAWYESVEGVTMAVLPHPSGRNRWYNNAICRRAARRFVRAATQPLSSRTNQRFLAALGKPGK